eukprot:4796795-Prymnesium_polylepis.1
MSCRVRVRFTIGHRPLGMTKAQDGVLASSEGGPGSAGAGVAAAAAGGGGGLASGEGDAVGAGHMRTRWRRSSSPTQSTRGSGAASAAPIVSEIGTVPDRDVDWARRH